MKIAVTVLFLERDIDPLVQPIFANRASGKQLVQLR